MNTVEPIRNPKKIAAIKKILKSNDHPRNYLLFVMGINTALRAGDLLGLTIGDVLNGKGEIADQLYIREEKTGREHSIRLNEQTKKALNFYFDKVPATDPDRYLFKSFRSDKPISRVRLWTLINSWCDVVGLTRAPHGCHTLRKTWGYQARKKYGVPIELIQAKYGHRSPAVTKRYIGITEDEIDTVEAKVNL